MRGLGRARAGGFGIPERARRRRDSRIPLPTSPAVSRVMRSNRARDTGPELLLRRALRQAGIRGYRTNWKRVPGRPDVAFPARRLAVFVHGCFWHQCPHCNLPLPRSNVEYWQGHLQRNRVRDSRKVRALRGLGWTVRAFWECEIRQDVARCAGEIESALGATAKAPRRRIASPRSDARTRG